MKQYFAPAGDNGQESGGAATDRGDDFVPTDGDEADTETKAAEKKDEADDTETKAAAAKAAEKKDEADPETKVEDDKSKKDTRVPLSRHKEMLRKERERRQVLEQQLAQYQKGTEVATVNEKITESETKLVKLEGEYAQLMKDGKVEDASAKMREIRALDRSIIESKADMKTAAATAQAIETVRYNTTLERVEAAYPALNPDGDEFDQAKSSEVIKLMRGLQAQGETPAAALQQAVRYVMGAPTTPEERTATTTKARVDKDEADEEAAKLLKTAERKEAATKKSIDTALKQPPSTSGVGADSDKAGGSMLKAKDVVKMPYADFAKLDEATLSRMRGDELV